MLRKEAKSLLKTGELTQRRNDSGIWASHFPSKTKKKEKSITERKRKRSSRSEKKKKIKGETKKMGEYLDAGGKIKRL